MTLLITDPVGFAVDWDWRCGLTVWSERGVWFDSRVAAHQLPTRPRSERHALRAAKRWWSTEGREQALRSGNDEHHR